MRYDLIEILTSFMIRDLYYINIYNYVRYSNSSLATITINFNVIIGTTT